MPQREFPLDFLASPWIKVTRTPETPLQALMETAPNDTPIESLQEMQQLRDAVSTAWDDLCEQDRDLLNAYEVERLSYTDIGYRFGFSQSTAHRLVRKARNNLKSTLRHHPVVIERYFVNKQIEDVESPLFQPGDWRAACRIELLWLAPDGLEAVVPDIVAALTIKLAQATHRWENGQREARISWSLAQMGRLAAAWLEQHDAWDMEATLDLLCQKQHDYGHQNILAYRMAGLVVRTSDKVARITNLMKRGGLSAVPGEGLADAFTDIIGYAAISRMLAYNTFELGLGERPLAT